MSTTITTEAQPHHRSGTAVHQDHRAGRVHRPPGRLVAAQEHGRRVRGHRPGVLRGHGLGALAEHLADTASKGDRLLVHGTTHDEQWTDRDGGTRTKHVIQVTALGVSLRYATATVHRANRAQSQSESEPAEVG